jgi:apolipoprotein D and lipocalin family protein
MHPIPVFVSPATQPLVGLTRACLVACCLWLCWTVVPQARAADAPPPLQTIAQLDVQRYLGTWHEIAKYPNRFQRQCVADTQARYRLLESGQIEVVNRCRLANGEMTEAVGRARQDGDSDSPRLQVRFAPAWLSFLPMVWGHYWVIDLDADYRLVAVSEPKREYLWVLSRTSQVAPAAYDALLARLKVQGFDLARLEVSAQTLKEAAP